MRIIIIGPIQGGSISIGRSIFSAFFEINRDTYFLDYSQAQKEMATILEEKDDRKWCEFILKCQRRLMKAVFDIKPDIIFAIAQSPINNTKMLENIKNIGITLCYWFVEDYQVFGYWKEIAPYFDYFFTIQKDPFFQLLKQINCSNYYYLPTAFNPNTNHTMDFNINEPRINISFVGAPYPNRVNFFNKLNRDDFQIYGEEWVYYECPGIITGDRRISEMEAQDIYKRSLININLHSSLNADSFGEGDFVNPRTFELAGLGVFQLTDTRKLFSLHFDLSNEIVALNTWDDMKHAIDYFLNNPKERESFAKKSQERVFQAHTYKHRVNEILQIIS